VSHSVRSLEYRVAEAQEKEKAEMLGKLKDLGNTILGNFGLSTDNFQFVKNDETGSYNVQFVNNAGESSSNSSSSRGENS